MLDVLSAFGLSSAAGLNAYLPLLIVGLVARYTDLITLNAPWNALEQPLVLVVLAVLVLIEMTVDKVPGVDSVNDLFGTIVRPLAGAVLFASSNNVISHVNPELAFVCGLLAAGGIHAVKATARPAVTATTMGIGNPAISLAEDVVSGFMTITAIVMPLLAALIVVLLVGLLVWLIVRRRRRLSHAPDRL